MQSILLHGVEQVTWEGLIKLMCSTHCIIKKPEVTVAQASCLY
ncbi:hypothetical protein [Anabaena sp. FACHB-1237]|nr:hypothetical protein [Anabaena sp. FACHB-1237]